MHHKLISSPKYKTASHPKILPLHCMASTDFAVPPCPSDDYYDDKLVDSPRKTVQEIMVPLEIECDEDGKKNENAANEYITSSINRRGVFLTWDDLWVTVHNGNKGSKSILQGITGYARPGEILAIMGPSGCGKSRLLDALAGRLNLKSKQSGEILVNGRKQHLAYGTSAYATQNIILTWTLTTREAVYYSALLQLPNTMSIAEKKERADMTIKVMGLESCIDTRIGGWGTKGLSSGQQKRVSICLEILTRPTLLFLDEPTSGLDSAASFYVMNRIVKFTKGYKMTVVASLHQPSAEIFKLLDNLCLLSSGRTIYFGPSDGVNQFLSKNGLSSLDLQNPADQYLLRINTDFNEEVELEPGVEEQITKKEITDMLVESYTSSETFNLILSEIAHINAQQLGVIENKGSHASFLTQCLVLIQRSFVNMYRDLGYFWFRLAIYIGLAVGLGTEFYNVGYSRSSINARGSVIMFTVAVLTLMATGGFPSFLEEMKVFQRERLNGHYGVATFVISNTISSIPFLFLLSVVPGAIAYYLVGLHHGIERFLYFIMTIHACIMLVEGIMMIVASFVTNFLKGLIISLGIQGLMTLSSGFFRLPNDLPKVFWKYPMFYISYQKYAFQGLYKNDFTGLKFPTDDLLAGGSSLIDGETILRVTWQMDMGSKWIDLAIMFLMVVAYRLLFFVILKIGEKIKPSN